MTSLSRCRTANLALFTPNERASLSVKDGVLKLAKAAAAASSKPFIGRVVTSLVMS